MRKLLILMISSCMFFILIGAFYCKFTGKEPITFSYVLKEFKESNIGFDIKNDIDELTISMENLDTESSYGGSDTFGQVASIAKTLFYGVRFIVKLVFHSLVASLNVLVLVCRCCGFDIPYIRLNGYTYSNDGVSGLVNPS